MLSKNILLSLSKPGRYINNELNTYHRTSTKATLKFCLAYPDIYEVGMSNLGFRIIYDILNQEPEVICERVFLPWVDLEDFLRKNNITLYSLESEIPLCDFDILGISIQTELNYTGVLNLLNLGKIPVFATERKEGFPLVIAGGSACFNPEPLAEFIDIFVVGEGEEIILEIINICKNRIKNLKQEKKEILIELARLEGIYVPSLYNVEYFPQGTIKEFYPLIPNIPLKIKRRVIHDLNNAYYPKRTILPYIEIIHDRIGIEIMRGCPHRCRFCQARNIYYPKRERDPAKIKELAYQNFRSSGYEEIALLSLSSLDHRDIDDIFSTLNSIFRSQGVGISLSSLRINAVMKKIIKEYQGTYRSGLTFAPEVGSERLRRIINKNIDINLFYEIVENIFKLGWRGLKLYFMIGLPEEKEKDLQEIIEMVDKILVIKKRNQNNSGKIRLSFNIFIPKPHSTFQWLPMEEEHLLKEKIKYFKEKIRNKLIKYNISSWEESWLEALISRGDRKLSKVIFKAWERGAKFDGWREQFNFPIWQKALEETKIDPNFYIHRKRTLEEILPWDFIETGVKKEELVADYKNFEKSLEIDRITI
ncbi:MAG: TIGR03960 family B12-binding radical SAM protein [Candidatus Omnitrophica bacterium]|nr:TIGR03960 family B12-binding radical SAM protein [Candidatus Omnitrophota bacterium]